MPTVPELKVAALPLPNATVPIKPSTAPELSVVALPFHVHVTISPPTVPEFEAVALPPLNVPVSILPADGSPN